MLRPLKKNSIAPVMVKIPEVEASAMTTHPSNTQFDVIPCSKSRNVSVFSSVLAIASKLLPAEV
jgi:hypothetical protein